MNVLSTNLKKLRLQKQLTQEQAAQHLQVSPQAVSRWETSVTTPDVMLLPEIARLYGVLVDDLFRPAPKGYGNEAIRLLAVFERTHRHEDFMAAYETFGRILQADTATADDWRSYGVLHEYMTYRCRDQAFSAYERAMEMSHAEDREMYHRIKRQRNLLRSRLGQDEDCIAEQKAAVQSSPDDMEEWVCLAMAYQLAKRPEEALAACDKALTRCPEDASLLFNKGDALRALRRYDEAFAAWEKAYAMDPRWLDALYSAAFCHEELGQYDDAAGLFEQISHILTQRGLEIEAKWPQERAEKCRRAAEKS